MERLTMNEIGMYMCNKDFETCKQQRENPKDEDCCCYCDILQKMVNKLGKYEDLEEQGLLLKLPCKPGDAVYKITTKYECDLDFECCQELFFKCEEDEYCEHHHKKHKVVKMAFELSMLDKPGAIFTTKEAAEQALKQI